MKFDASKLEIVPPDELKVAAIVQIAEILEETPHWSLDSYIDLVRKNSPVRRIVLVAQFSPSEEVVGFVIARPVPPEAELESIGVTAAFQRHGIGTGLMEALAENLARAGIEKLLLEVRASNSAAVAFYRSLGFVETGRRPLYYADPVEDAVLMRLELS